jgi:hypothetical protein
MPLFAAWCDCCRDENDRKRLWQLTERDGGRAAIAGELANVLRGGSKSFSSATLPGVFVVSFFTA